MHVHFRVRVLCRQVAMGKGSQGDWQCPKPDCVNHVRMVFGHGFGRNVASTLVDCVRCVSVRVFCYVLSGVFGRT